MPNKELRILLQDDTAENISWVMFENDRAVNQPQQGTIADLPIVDAKIEVAVYVPTTNVTMLNVTLPEMPAAQRAQAALYALEEQLAEDVQDLHAVVWQQGEPHHYSIAIIRKSILQNWLNKFKEANIFPIGLFPDIVTVPANNDEWAIVSHGDLIYVKTSNEMGFAIESDYVQSILVNTLLTTKNPPKQIKVYDNKEKILSLLFNDLHVPIYTVVEDEKNDSKYFWVNCIYHELHCNFLQGDMLPHETFLEKYKIWKTPAILTGIFVLLISLTTTLKWFYLSYEESLLTKQIASIYMQIFPQATSVVNPKERISQLMSSNKLLAGGTEFFDLLGLSGAVINQVPQIKVQNISFTAKQLVLQVRVDNANSLSKLNKTFSKYPITVKQGDTTSSGSAITAKFYITRQAS